MKKLVLTEPLCVNVTRITSFMHNSTLLFNFDPNVHLVLILHLNFILIVPHIVSIVAKEEDMYVFLMEK